MKTSAKKGYGDMELMLYADGELSPEEAREVAAWLAEDADARLKLESLRQVCEAVRTYAELETDEAEVEVPAFAELWPQIERRIQSNGRPPIAAQAAVPAGERAAPARPERVSRAEAQVRPSGERSGSSGAPAGIAGWWAGIRRWFEDHRGHVLTGAFSAGVACALMLSLGPRERIIERVRESHPVGTVPAVLRSQPPEVEDLEVYEGSGTILTIEPDGADDSAAAVIWLSDDHDPNREGPL